MFWQLLAITRRQNQHYKGNTLHVTYLNYISILIYLDL
jgi:hypothetical protein